MANIKLKKPQIGAQSWGDSINLNFTQIEKYINKTTAKVSSLEQDLKDIRELKLSGGINIAGTQFKETNTNEFELLLEIHAINSDGKYSEDFKYIDIYNVPMNTCYKVMYAYDQNIEGNSLDPRAIKWAMGDFLVVGEVPSNTTGIKSFSRLPISIGMYMKPTLGTEKIAGNLVWIPEMAETHLEQIVMPLPVHYSYGTVNVTQLKTNITSYKVGIVTTHENEEEPLTGENSFSTFPIIKFYQCIKGQSELDDQIRWIEIGYTLTKTKDTNNQIHWQVNLDFDDNDDMVKDEDNIWMYVIMLASHQLIESINIVEVDTDDETI